MNFTTTTTTTKSPMVINDGYNDGDFMRGSGFYHNKNTNNNNKMIDNDHRKCALPQYIALSATFAFLCVSLFLR